MNKLGYCCINVSINEDGRKKKDYIKVNRGMVKRTFEEKGLDYVSELVILNLKDTIEILNWNIENDISVYRLSSDSFPWLTEYKLEDLPNFSEIKTILEEIGRIVKDNNLRVSYHPGPFNVLGSENENVVNKTIHELNFTASILDYMKLDKSPYYPINIHLNTTKPTREEAAQRFVDNFSRLSESAKARLTVENDDKEGQYSVKLLHELVHTKTDIPIVFDFHHFNYGPKDQNLEEALTTALGTWKGYVPMTHMSSSKLNEDESGRATAHSDYIYEEIPFLSKYKFDCEIEAKAKDKAVIKYLNDFGNTIL
jgi:UV DNA damage endonuclease